MLTNSSKFHHFNCLLSKLLVNISKNRSLFPLFLYSHTHYRCGRQKKKTLKHWALVLTPKIPNKNDSNLDYRLACLKIHCKSYLGTKL